MIGNLRGKIQTIGTDWLLIDVRGVGYEVHVPKRLLVQLTEGIEAQITIETHVREDHIHLYGFANMAEREWFRTLTSVQGVGAKMGLAMLSAYAPEQLALMIASKDAKALTAISGIGPKLAERLVVELKNKVSKLATGPVALPANSDGGVTSTPDIQPASNNNADMQRDAASALANLGYSQSEAFQAVATAIQQHGAANLDDAIKLGLKELARA